MSNPVTPADIVSAVLAAVWENLERKGDPPDLSDEKLAAWLPECREKDRSEAGRRLRSVSPDTVPAASLEWFGAPEPPEAPWTDWLYVVATAPDGIPLYADESRTDVVATVPMLIVGTLTDLHRKWAEMPDGERPQHPLAPIVEGRITRDRRLGEHHLIVKGERQGEAEQPLLLARAPGVLQLATLAAVEVDGEVFATRTIEGVTKRTRRRRIAAPRQGELWPGPRSLGGRATAGAVVEAVASLALDGDERSSLRPDVLRLGHLAYALTGTVRLSEAEGARLIGGADTPANRRRWNRATVALRWLHFEARPGILWSMADAEAGDVNRIGPPRLWVDYWRAVEGIDRKERAARKAAGLSGDPIGWRLSGFLFLPVEAPATGKDKREDRTAHRWAAVARTIAGIEGALAWGPTAGLGKGGRTPDNLRPVRPGGPGPEVFVEWWQVLRLSGENVGEDARYIDPLKRRYERRVEALRAARHFAERTGTAEAGGTVEFVEARSGAKGRPGGGLVVRASARYCAAYAGGALTRIPARRLLGS